MNNNFPTWVPQTRYIGYGLLAIPTVFLLIFAIGEFFSGQSGGFLHLIQLVPLFVLAALSRRRTKLAGILLMIAALLLGIFYFFATIGSEIWVQGLVELILFIPSFLAGLYFVLISR